MYALIIAASVAAQPADDAAVRAALAVAVASSPVRERPALKCFECGPGCTCDPCRCESAGKPVRTPAPSCYYARWDRYEDSWLVARCRDGEVPDGLRAFPDRAAAQAYCDRLNTGRAGAAKAACPDCEDPPARVVVMGGTSDTQPQYHPRGERVILGSAPVQAARVPVPFANRPPVWYATARANIPTPANAAGTPFRTTPALAPGRAYRTFAPAAVPGGSTPYQAAQPMPAFAGNAGRSFSAPCSASSPASSHYARCCVGSG